MDHDAWLASGERIRVELRSGDYEIFCRVAGKSGPWVTLLHGFPTSSWDWAEVSATLETRSRVIAFDFLGFGDSDKPRGHAYSIFEQAELVEAVWRRRTVEASLIVAHDYGATVAQELLALRGENGLRSELDGVVLLNSALYVHLARPLAIQRVLATPALGPVLSRAVTQRTFARSLASVISPEHSLSPDQLRAHWDVVRRRGGVAAAPRLLRYMAERRRHAPRWEKALERADLPLTLVWGMADPRSGAPIVEHLQARIPGARIVPLSDVGHYPQLEAPDVVAEAIAVMLARVESPRP